MLTLRKKADVPPGINRYIMECKSKYAACFSRYSWELIDTLWNVNDDVSRLLTVRPKN